MNLKIPKYSFISFLRKNNPIIFLYNIPTIILLIATYIKDLGTMFELI